MRDVNRAAAGAFLSGLLLTAPAMARDAAAPPTIDDAPASDKAGAQAAPPTPAPAAAEEEKLKHPDILDLTLSIEGELEADETPRSTHLSPQPSLPGWFGWKQRFEARTGITFGGSYGVSWQNYSTSAFGDRDAVGHKFTFNASAALVNRGKPNALDLDVAIEDRRPLGTDFAPLEGGVRAGSGVPTAATWGDFSLGVTQAYVRQNLAAGKFQYAIGKLFAPNFVNAYPFFDDNRQFFNLAFATSPTIAVPLRGFGFVGTVFPGAGNAYAKAGMFTANSSDTGFTADEFFSRNEHFYFVEVGRTGFARQSVPIHARGPMDRDNFHVTLWYRDPLELREGESPGLSRPSPEAYGAAFNANFMAGDSVMWFLRGGLSQGGFAEANMTGGFGWRPRSATSDLFGFGVGWTRPEVPDLGIPLPDLRDQYTIETFYRFHLLPIFAITPGYQLLVHPSLAPSRDTLWVFSLRARLVF